MQPKHFVLPLLVTALAVLAGCGGSDDSSGAEASNDSPSNSGGPVTTSALSKTKYSQQANAICVQYREDRADELSSYLEENGGGEGGASNESLVEWVRTGYADSLKDEIAELRELGAPRGDEAEIEKILAGFERAADAASELESIEAKAAVNRDFVRASKAANAYGIQECAG